MTEHIEVPMTPEQEAEIAAWEAGQYQRDIEAVSLARHSAYTAPNGSDAVYMKHTRGEATMEEYLAAKAAIDEANPYPAAPKAKKK